MIGLELTSSSKKIKQLMLVKYLLAPVELWELKICSRYTYSYYTW